MMRQSQLSTLFAFTLLCYLVSSAWASTYQLSHTFQPDDPENAPFFGSAVVLEDGVAAIKSNSGYFDGDGLSVTHIYEQRSDGNWLEAATLAYDSGDNDGNPFLGQELAIDNGEIVISYALHYRNLSNSSHLQFATRDDSGWKVQFNEPTPDRLPREEPVFEPFGSSLPGRSVDISGNLAIVEDSEIGIARIYEKSEEGLWSESANLEPISSSFGTVSPYSVAIDGTTAVATSRAGDNSSESHLYFFELSPAGDWSQAGEFPLSNRNFISVVEIEGDTAVLLDIVSSNIIFYERISGVWQESQELANTGFSTRYRRLAFDDGIVAYSVAARDEIPAYVELVHENPSGEWEVYETIYDPNPELGYLFGESFALDQGRLLVGAPNWVSEEQPGLTYLFTQVPEPSAALLAMLASFIGGLQRRTR